MNVNAGKDRKEGDFGIASDLQLMKVIIVQYTIIDSLNRGAILIVILPFIRAIRNRAEHADVIIVIYVYSASNRKETASLYEWAEFDLTHHKWTAVFCPASMNIITIVIHGDTSQTNWCDVIIQMIFLLPSAQITVWVLRGFLSIIEIIFE